MQPLASNRVSLSRIPKQACMHCRVPMRVKRQKTGSLQFPLRAHTSFPGWILLCRIYVNRHPLRMVLALMLSLFSIICSGGHQVVGLQCWRAHWRAFGEAGFGIHLHQCLRGCFGLRGCVGWEEVWVDLPLYCKILSLNPTLSRV